MGFTFCWDNTQLEVKARMQDTTKNVWQRLWALCYAATNRVATVLNADRVPLKLLSEIPIHVFLPNAAHGLVLRQWLLHHIKWSMVQYMPAFKQVKISKYIKHEYWHEMAQKSEIVSIFKLVCYIHEPNGKPNPDTKYNLYKITTCTQHI